jgi:hypothetical protein
MAGKPQHVTMQVAREYAVQESRALREYARAGRRPPPATPTAFPWRPNYLPMTINLQRHEVLPDATDRSDQPHLRRAS